ncbi:MAG: toll/interleukin-1 receptor domain-containing protein [Anaerolineae bacterium]|nr:toll/interleukin-1 receptor domain-containing protein [Anaerolineae bacterium]MDW8172958.1 toll/interleukin-1 receptor domain-containing protein [Anaerolineae bacterium]
MKLLQHILIPARDDDDSVRERRIELYHGNLTTMPPEMAVDVLVVSAFPNNYDTRNPRSLVSALAQMGVSVAQLAQDKEADLRGTYHCWLSRSINPSLSAPFRRLLVFEPPTRSNPAELVGDIFQALIPFVEGEPFVRSLALPLVAGGSQQATPEQMIPPLLDAAVHWLSLGLSLEVIRLVEIDEGKAQRMAELFTAFMAKPPNSSLPIAQFIAPSPASVFVTPPPAPVVALPSPARPISEAEERYTNNLDLTVVEPEEALNEEATLTAAAPTYSYDFFISYSRRNSESALFVYHELLRLRPQTRIFFDKKELEAGVAWQIELYEALDDCRQVIALLSPDYLLSKVCKEEYHIALMRHRQNDGGVLVPIYLHEARLPTYMRLYQFHDCREADRACLTRVCEQLIAAL